jgi:hypothetical protein
MRVKEKISSVPTHRQDGEVEMVGKRGKQPRRVFSVELDSGDDLLKVNVPNRSQRIMVEGTIGALKHAGFVEDTVLELVGTDGILRVDLSRDDIAKHVQKEVARG